MECPIDLRIIISSRVVRLVLEWDADPHGEQAVRKERSLPMNLSQLYYFSKLSELEHFSKAAKELYITQP